LPGRCSTFRAPPAALFNRRLHLQAGKTAALLYAGIGAVFGVIMLVASGFQEEGGGKQAVTAIFMPVILSATGFIGVMAVAAFYNIIAKRFGGFEFTIAVEPFPPTQGFPFLDPRPRIDVNDEIRALAKLKEEGLITEDEFTKRKQAILNL
jgi:hypothetical protein